MGNICEIFSKNNHNHNIITPIFDISINDTINDKLLVKGILLEPPTYSEIENNNFHKNITHIYPNHTNILVCNNQESTTINGVVDIMILRDMLNCD